MRAICSCLILAAAITGIAVRQWQVQTPATVSNAETDFVHHVGSVVEGSQVSHEFTVRNPLPVFLAIESEAEIQKTCGCTNLTLSTHRLGPGEQTTVQMRVNTSGKNGRFRVGAILTWLADNGEMVPMSLFLEGTATPAISASPTFLRFSPSDVNQQATRRIVIENPLAADWSTLETFVEPPYAEVVEKTLEGPRMVLLLRPRAPADALEFNATLRISVDLAEAKGGARRSTLNIPLQGSQDIEMQVSPRVVFAGWSRQSNSGAARFIVRRLASKSVAPITAIHCEGFATDWKSSVASISEAAKYQTLQVQMTISKLDDSPSTSQGNLINVAFSDGSSVDVPVQFVFNQDRG